MFAFLSSLVVSAVRLWVPGDVGGAEGDTASQRATLCHFSGEQASFFVILQVHSNVTPQRCKCLANSINNRNLDHSGGEPSLFNTET